MEWNGTKISVWNKEDARMEWNGRQSSILPYQFHTRFRALYLQKNTHRCRVVIKYCHRSIQLQYLRILLVDKSRYFGCVHCANSDGDRIKTRMKDEYSFAMFLVTFLRVKIKLWVRLDIDTV